MNLSNSIQMFYKNVIESSSDDVRDDDSKLMMATTMLLHEHNSRPLHRGSVEDVRPMSSANMRRATTNSIRTTSILPSHI
jgi:hypothetical protein